MVINKTEIIGWLEHPITKLVTKRLHNLKVDEERALISGAHLSDPNKTAYTVGFLAGLSEFLEIKPEEVFKSEESKADRL